MLSAPESGRFPAHATHSRQSIFSEGNIKSEKTGHSKRVAELRVRCHTLTWSQRLRL